LRIDQSPQPIPVTSVKKETPEERFLRLKWLSDVTGKRLIRVYLDDEKHQQGHHR
jgi:hypothetical protein